MDGMGDPGKKRGEGEEGGEKRTPPNKPATTVSLDSPPSNPRARQGVERIRTSRWGGGGVRHRAEGGRGTLGSRAGPGGAKAATGPAREASRGKGPAVYRREHEAEGDGCRGGAVMDEGFRFRPGALGGRAGRVEGGRRAGSLDRGASPTEQPPAGAGGDALAEQACRRKRRRDEEGDSTERRREARKQRGDRDGDGRVSRSLTAAAAFRQTRGPTVCPRVERPDVRSIRGEI
ncbi:hypothetical protein M432DRAFT_30545 [Thermoascus aurantiacus ATCC 26904]